MSQTSADRQRLRALPKAEIHVHLEGCFSRQQIVDLAAAAGETLPRPPEDLFAFRNLAQFLGFLDWSCDLVRSEAQVEAMAYAFCVQLAENGAGYADPIINPTHWPSWRRRLPAMIAALDRGFTSAERDGLPPVGLCLSLLRQQSADEATELLDMMIALRNPPVVALSIDGNEASAGRTGPRFADTFRRASSAGFRRTVHAGESSGPEGIRDAIRLLGAERIDHGVRAAEDVALMDEIRDLGIPLDITPASNVRLGLYQRYEDHPIERLRQHGIAVSVGTDDPELLETTLVDEYARMVETFGWDDDVLRAVARTSIEAPSQGRRSSAICRRGSRFGDGCRAGCGPCSARWRRETEE